MRKQIAPVLLAGMPAFSATLMSGQSKDALYRSLGGNKAITAVVDDLVARVAADNRINGYFKQTAADPKRLASFKTKLVDQICEASGGPCKYTGKTMKDAHAHLHITENEWGIMTAEFKKSLDKFKVPAAEQKELFDIVGKTKDDIVEKK